MEKLIVFLICCCVALLLLSIVMEALSNNDFLSAVGLPTLSPTATNTPFPTNPPTMTLLPLPLAATPMPDGVQGIINVFATETRVSVLSTAAAAPIWNP